MRNKSVAVLDIRSGEICAAIAEKGVNNTFIIKSKYSVPYDGYAEGELLDIVGFISAVREAVEAVFSSVNGLVKQVYVSIPAEFTETVATDKVLTFNSTQKITAKHIDALTSISVPKVLEGKRVIGCGALYYILSDKRRVSDPLGVVSDSLRAGLSFFICKTGIIDCIESAFGSFPSVKVFHWIAQSYALSQYLLEPEKRESYSVLLDLGYISSTFNVVCGNGIAYSEPFSVGIGHIALLLSEALDVPFDAGMELIGKVNLNAKEGVNSIVECNADGADSRYSEPQLRDLIREGLDGICEMIETCRQSFLVKDLSAAPINISGEGVGVIRGTIEHLSSRLVTPVEVVAPKVPYYDKPQFSSLFSLLSAALGNNRAR